jgi:hypothetical protein
MSFWVLFFDSSSLLIGTATFWVWPVAPVYVVLPVVPSSTQSSERSMVMKAVLSNVDGYEKSILAKSNYGATASLYLNAGEVVPSKVILDPKRLTERFRSSLFNLFFPMTLRAYDQRANNEWFREAVWHRMFGSDVLNLVFDGYEPVAF